MFGCKAKKRAAKLSFYFFFSTFSHRRGFSPPTHPSHDAWANRDVDVLLALRGLHDVMRLAVNHDRLRVKPQKAAHISKCRATNLLLRHSLVDHEGIQALKAKSHAWVGLRTSALVRVVVELREREGKANGVNDLGGGKLGGHGIYLSFGKLLVRVGLFRSVRLF